jgi:uncharacterized protein with HEPN domain
MSKHDPSVTLRQIVEYARRAQELCAGTTLPELVSDWRNALAFERVMEVLGEAAKRLPPDLRDRYPAVPWNLIVGMRDRVAHGYDAVDYQILWDAVQQDVPSLLKTAEQMLTELNRPLGP